MENFHLFLFKTNPKKCHVNIFMKFNGTLQERFYDIKQSSCARLLLYTDVGSIYISKSKIEQPPYGFPSDVNTHFIGKFTDRPQTSCPLVIEIYLGGKHIFQFLIFVVKNL